MADQCTLTVNEWDIDGGYDPDEWLDRDPTPQDLGLPGPDELIDVPPSVVAFYMELYVDEDSFNADQYMDDWLSDEFGFLHHGWQWEKEPEGLRELRGKR
jgi:hypothetical protein